MPAFGKESPELALHSNVYSGVPDITNFAQLRFGVHTNLVRNNLWYKTWSWLLGH